MKKSLPILVGLLFASPAYAGWFTDMWAKAEPVVKSDTVQQMLGQQVNSISQSDAAGALKQLLEIGSGKVVDRLGKTDGFLADKAVQIALPQEFQLADAYLSKIGLGGLTDGLKTRMNRAAEEAMPEARALFVQTIQQMSWQDALNIVKGSDDAATTYFKDKMSPALTEKFTPIVQAALQQAGAVQAYDNVVAQVKKTANLPFLNQMMPDITTDLTTYTVQKTLDGAFYYMAAEEKAIREDPAARTTALLQKVFQ